MGSDIIKISHLTKNFGDVKAVNDLNFKVKRGELFAFLGVNGAGKTTTLKSVVGILQFDQAGWYCTVAGYDYVVWSYINGYHDSTFDFFGGKSLWIAQSLPVTPWQVLRAKLDMQFILNGIPVMLCMICTAVVCPIKIGQFIMILQVLSFVFVMAVFGLFMGVIKPVLTWTNELTPIKQSASVMVTMFGGFGYTALLFIGYMVLPGYTFGYICYIGIFIAANVVAGLTLYIWLRTKGCDRFAEL